MTYTMLFDTAGAGVRRFPSRGEVWSRLLRRLLSLLRTEVAASGGAPPDAPRDEPPTVAAMELETKGLARAYDALLFRPTFAKLAVPEPDPDPKTVPPGGVDPPPSGYQTLEAEPRPWPTLLRAVLDLLFPS